MRADVAMYAFTGPPQPVEVQYRGIWYHGELLGWRNQPDGRCVTRVRCVVGRFRHSAWVELADLRLPEPGADAVPNPPVDLRPAPPEPTPGTTPPGPQTPDLPLLDGDTRPHELLPRRSPRRLPPPPAFGATSTRAFGAKSAGETPAPRPLPPPRAYQQQYYAPV